MAIGEVLGSLSDISGAPSFQGGDALSGADSFAEFGDAVGSNHFGGDFIVNKGDGAGVSGIGWKQLLIMAGALVLILKVLK